MVKILLTISKAIVKAMNNSIEIKKQKNMK